MFMYHLRFTTNHVIDIDSIDVKNARIRLSNLISFYEKHIKYLELRKSL